MKVKEYPWKYCGKCGSKLIRKQKEAQKGHNSFGYRFSRFNTTTGKQQYIEWYQCPNYKWWNGHDGYYPHLLSDLSKN